MEEQQEQIQPVVFSWVPSVLFPLNLVVFAVQVPLSVFNFVLIYRTSMLHPNLKYVLYAQCACFCTFAVAHGIQIFIIRRIITNAHPDMLAPLIDAKERMHVGFGMDYTINGRFSLSFSSQSNSATCLAMPSLPSVSWPHFGPDDTNIIEVGGSPLPGSCQW